MPNLSLIVLLSLSTYRVTRFFLRDTLIDQPREWVYMKLLRPNETAIGKGQKWRDKVYELLDCPYCLSVWVAGFSVLAVTFHLPVPLPVFAWLAASAGAMIVWRFVERDEEEG